MYPLYCGLTHVSIHADDDILYSCRMKYICLPLNHSHWRSILHGDTAMSEDTVLPKLKLRVPTGEEEEGVGDDAASESSSVAPSRYDSDEENRSDPKPDTDEANGLPMNRLTIGQPTSPSASNVSSSSHTFEPELDPPTKESMTQLRNQMSALGATIDTMRMSQPKERDDVSLQSMETERSRMLEKFLEGMRKLRDQTVLAEQLSRTDE